MKYILSLILIMFTFQSLANHQTINGNNNNAIIGDNNKLKSNININKGANLLEYYSAKAKEDLENGNYKDIYFEEKKDISLSPSAKKKLLILTATNFETNILHEEALKLELKATKEIINDMIIYNLGTSGNIEIYHMQPSMMGMLEPGSTPLALMSVFHNLRPDYIIATGIAYGRESKGQKLGDILVSSQVVNYETRKETNGNIYFRGDKASSPLLARINAGIHSWQGAKVHTGLVLSGNVLVNSKEFLEYLSKKEPEYAGGDMESYGVYAVSSMVGAKWIMIKGISDWGDGTKNDNFHKITLHNVCDFIFHVIKQGDLK